MNHQEYLAKRRQLDKIVKQNERTIEGCKVLIRDRTIGMNMARRAIKQLDKEFGNAEEQ